MFIVPVAAVLVTTALQMEELAVLAAVETPVRRE